MKIVLTKSVLLDFLKRSIRENRTGHTADISMIPAKDSEGNSEFGPIIPDEQMSVQLSSAAPPVSDDTFVPSSIPELGDAARVIASEVPDEARYIEKFYQMLHKVLDKIHDDEREANRAIAYGEEEFAQQQQPDNSEPEPEELAESQLRLYIQSLLLENPQQNPEVKNLSSEAQSFYTSAFMTLLDGKEYFLPKGVVATVGGIEDTPENRSEMKIKMFNFLANHVDFRDANYADDPELMKARKFAVHDALDHYFYRSDQPSDEEMTQLSQAAEQGKEDRAIRDDRYSAVRDAMSLWDANQGDLDAIKIALDGMVGEEGGSQKAIYFQAAHDAIVHIEDDYADRLNKTKFEQVLKAVLHSEDLNPLHADDVFDVSWIQTVDTPEEEDLASILQGFDQHLDKMAPFFGYENASGLSQWMTKFPERMFKVLGGGATGLIEEFSSFTNDIFSALEDFCLNATDQIEKMSAKEKDPAKKTKLENLTSGFQLMRSQILDTEAEELELKTLQGTGAGWVVRFAFGRTVTQPLFKKLHSDWDAAMRAELERINVSDPKRVITKTLIGETDPLGLEDDAVFEKVGISKDAYKQVLKTSSDWFTNYFSENRKELRKIMSQRSQDVAKIKNAIKKAVSDDVPDELSQQAAQGNFADAEMRASRQASQEAEQSMTESSFEKALHETVNKMIGNMS